MEPLSCPRPGTSQIRSSVHEEPPVLNNVYVLGSPDTHIDKYGELFCRVYTFLRVEEALACVWHVACKAIHTFVYEAQKALVVWSKTTTVGQKKQTLQTNKTAERDRKSVV